MKVKKQGGTAHHAARCGCPRPTKACIRPWASLLKRLGIFLMRKERNPLMTQTEDITPLSTEDTPLVPIEKIVSLCKRRGFVYPNSEIYGGVSGIYDFGPLGVELRNNIRRFWWWSMVQTNDNVVGIEGAIITHPRVWEASGHVENFVDQAGGLQELQAALPRRSPAAGEPGAEQMPRVRRRADRAARLQPDDGDLHRRGR